MLMDSISVGAETITQHNSCMATLLHSLWTSCVPKWTPNFGNRGSATENL